ncbi:MAG: 5-formyltetrahydrofolate cyclo-ligase [Candidatus Micrarchaeota archaeon]|nr:5-formyltetrahydrofolate cyclo-ligase [Candidatus Micrarchaeota archaeon]
MKNKVREGIKACVMAMKDREEAEKKIAEKILDSEEFAKAKCVFCYVSKEGEVGTHEIIMRALERGKRVFVPKVRGNEMFACEIGSLIGLESGSFGVMEPKGARRANEKYIDLALVPGVAFDERGNRLGRGKGYFDSFIPKLRCLVIGLAFECQVVDEVPVEKHDAKVDAVVTEKRTLVFKRDAKT